MSRSWRSLAVLGALALALPLVAGADPADTYNADASPGVVQPSSSKPYTVTLANSGGSVDNANQATIAIPAGFTVDSATLSASTSASGGCTAASWTATVDVVNSRLDLSSPADPASELCPGGTLTVGFDATASASEGVYSWTTGLTGSSGSFTLEGSQPSVAVDGSPPPDPSIDTHPPAASSSSDASFGFTDAEAGVSFQCQRDGGGFSACSSPRSYSGLADGPHTFDVKARDTAGNESTATSFSWTVDTAAPPTPTIDSNPADPSSSSSASFSFSDAEAGVAFLCQRDGGGFSACTSPKIYLALADGPHTFEVKARDAAGNESSVVTFSWTIDTAAPPTPTIDSNPADPSSSSSASFSFSDAEAGVAFLCQRDGGGFAACTSPKSYSGLADGPHTFEVKARDAAGNESAVASFGWTIDTINPPAPSIDTHPPAVSSSSAASFGFTDAEAGVSFQCQRDGGGFAACTSPKSYSSLADGPHTFDVKARDAAGNESGAASFSWTIDTANPPAPSIDTHPPAASSSSDASFGFTDAEAGVAFLCQRDGGGFAACTSPKSYSGLADGPHTFDVKARDAAGNESAVSTFSWTVDTAAPPAPAIDSTPSNPSNTSSPTFTFSDAEAGVAFLCQRDGGGFAACTSPKSYSSLADGPHTFEVKARDAAGNDSLVSTSTWTIDTVAPLAPTIDSNPANPTSATSATFAFSDTEPGVTFWCRLDSPSFAPCTSPTSYPALVDGAHTFRVKAIDAAGNESAVATFGWTIDTAPPPVPNVDSHPPALSGSANASLGFTDSEVGIIFQCRLDSDAFAVCTSPKDYSGLTDGSHTFGVRAIDTAGNASAVSTFTWTIDTAAPPVPSIDSHPPTLTPSPNASFGFNDAEAGLTFQCRLDAAAFAACTSPKDYSGLADGAHTFRVKAVDAAGNESTVLPFTWTIDTAAPPAPTIGTHPPPLSASASASFGFTDSEAGITFQCSLDAAAFTACTSPKAYSGVTDGFHTFRVEARDAAGNESTVSPFTWTIDTMDPPPPTINSGPSNPSNMTSASFAFSDSEAGVTFQCRLDGAAFSSCTSPQSYSPLSADAHTFEVKALDAAANESTASSFGWTIDTTLPAAPTIGTHPPPLSASASASFGFTDSEAGITFQCSLDAAAFAACTSPQSYSSLADGSHTFGVKAIDAAANESGVTSFAWTVDTAAPPAPAIGSTPPTQTSSPNASVGFNDAESGVTFQCSLDAAAFAACTSPKDYSGLADGSHTFGVKAIDTAGNESGVTSFAWTIDTTAPPAPSIDSGPANPSNTSNPTLTFSDAEAGVAFQCQRDGASFSACTSPKSYSGLADGPHSFQVKARDAAGNESAAVSFTWSIDTVPPGTTITSAPPATTNSLSASFVFSASETATFECRLDGEAFASCTSPKNYAGLAPGFHVFEARATDPAGNTGPSATYDWTIDTTPPPMPDIDPDAAPPPVTDATSATFVFSDTEPGVTFRCRLDTPTFTSCASPRDYSGLGNGSHTFEVKARDAAGNESLAATWTWTVDTVKPVVTIASHPEDPTNQTSATFTFSSNKDPGPTFDCKLDGGSFIGCTSPKTYSGLSDGVHTVQVRAKDASGTGAPTTFTWTVDTVPPPAPAIGGGPPAATNATSATFVFSDSELGLSFECRRDAGAFAACTSPMAYPGLSNGSHAFAVRAIDAAGNTGPAGTRSWTVDTVPPDTAVSSGPDPVSGSSSATFAFASSEGGSSFTCSIEGGGFAPCVSPQTYGGFPDGPHSFRVRATDAAGNTDATPASYSWTVDVLGASRTDRTPPANVAHVVKGVGYRTLRLTWTKPSDIDFARVQVLVTNDPRGAPGIVVYNGTGTSYTDAKFRNGVYYRYAVISYDRAGNASRGVTIVVPSNALLGKPRDGANVKTAPLLDWATVRSATFYNVQLYVGSKKVLSAWPRSSKLKLKKRWSYRGRRYTLKKGRYRWYVWPGFGRLTTARYGQLIGQSTFVVR